MNVSTRLLLAGILFLPYATPFAVSYICGRLAEFKVRAVPSPSEQHQAIQAVHIWNGSK